MSVAIRYLVLIAKYLTSTKSLHNFFVFFCIFILFVLCHLVRQSIWTSMQNLKSVAQKMAELWVLLYLCTFLYFCTFFVRKWLRAVKIYLHAKFRASSSKIERVMVNFVLPPPINLLSNSVIITTMISTDLSWIIHQ